MKTGTAVFNLVNLYTVNVEKILDLYQGLKLVVKFYTDGEACYIPAMPQVLLEPLNAR